MSFRSPIIFAWPGTIEAGVRTDAIIHSAGIPATILDYVSIEVPGTYFGQSYKSFIEGTTCGLRDYAQGNVIMTRSKNPNNVMGDQVEGYWVRDGHWSLRWHAIYDEVQLFDLRTDPRNDINVAEENPEAFDRLMGLVRSYTEEKGLDPRLAYYQSLNN